MVKPAEYKKPLPEVVAFRLYQELHTHHSFEIEVLYDLLESKAESFMRQANDKLVGKSIAISITENTLTREVHKFDFTGIVTNLVMSSTSDLAGAFVIKGYSSSILLSDGVQKRTFRDVTLASIVEQVLDPYPENIINPTLAPLSHTALVPYVVQYNESNFDFLNRLLATYREWFYSDGTKLCIGKSPDEQTTSVFMNGYWSTFQLEAAIQPATVSLYAYDPVEHRQLQVAAPDPSGSIKDSNAKLAVKTSRQVFKQAAHLMAAGVVSTQGELLKEATSLS